MTTAELAVTEACNAIDYSGLVHEKKSEPFGVKGRFLLHPQYPTAGESTEKTTTPYSNVWAKIVPTSDHWRIYRKNKQRILFKCLS